MRYPTAALLILAAPLAAQDEGEDWRMPFRSPGERIEPPPEMFRELRTMLARAEDPEVRVYFDERGIEVCDDPAWRAAYERLLAMPHDAGYLSQIIRLSGTDEHRALALYGMFYNPDLALVMQMLNHIPGEPLPRLREDGYRRAIEFLRVQLPKTNPGDLEAWQKMRVGPGGQRPPKPGEWSHSFDAEPYFALLSIDSPLDQQQALWFLGEVVRVRPDLWKDYLAAAAPVLPALVVHDDRGVRQHACDFVELLDPQHREAPSIDASADALARWLGAVFYDVFPPLRPVAPGLMDLYRSEELQRVVALGKELLQNGSLGDTEQGELQNGTHYRGLRIARMPAPLGKLGFEIGHVVTAINGVPVATCEDVLRTLEGSAWKRSFMVEFVQNGKLHAREFRCMF